jgi:hypothetical protein
VEKHDAARQAIGENITMRRKDALSLLDSQSKNTDALIIFNTYRFSTVKRIYERALYCVFTYIACLVQTRIFKRNDRRAISHPCTSFTKFKHVEESVIKP